VAVVDFFDRTPGFFLTVVGFFVGVLRDPDVTRLECFVRCRIVLVGAASAIELRAKVATRATSSILIVFRIIDSSVTVR
jgi:hypothetical protein